MFANKTFILTKDALTTKAHTTTTAKPVFIFAITRGADEADVAYNSCEMCFG